MPIAPTHHIACGFKPVGINQPDAGDIAHQKQLERVVRRRTPHHGFDNFQLRGGVVLPHTAIGFHEFDFHAHLRFARRGMLSDVRKHAFEFVHSAERYLRPGGAQARVETRPQAIAGHDGAPLQQLSEIRTDDHATRRSIDEIDQKIHVVGELGVP